MPIQRHGNASATGLGINGTSPIVDVDDEPYVSAFGTSSAAATVTVQVSQDGTNFYDTTHTAAPGAGAAFHIFFTTAARFVRLKVSAATNLVATIAGNAG